MPPVNVVRPDGSVASVPEESVAALERLGYRREEAAEATRRAGEEATAAYYDTPSQKAIAFGEGALGGATLGLAELALDDQVSREREEHLGGWKLGGEVFGTVATALATGGSGAVGSTARATPAGAALVFGEKAAAKIANPIGRAAAANAIEGGISSGALTAAKVLTDNDPDTVESFLGEVGLGTVFGIGAGALGGAGFEALGQVGAKAVQRIERRIGQASGDDLVKSERGLAAAQEARAHFDDAEKILSREASLIDEQLALKQKLLEDARKLVDGDGPTYTDLIEEALRRQAAGEPIPNSYIARLGDEMAGEKPPTPHDWLVSGGPVPENLGRVAEEAGVPRPQVKAEGPQVEAKTGAATPAAVKAADPNKTGAGKLVPPPSPASPVSKVTDRVYLVEKAEANLPEVNKRIKEILGPDASAERLAAIWEPPPGYSSSVHDFRVDDGKLVMEGTFRQGIGPYGEQEGFIERSLRLGEDGKPEIVHDSLWLLAKETSPSAALRDAIPPGFGREISRKALESYSRAGIKRVVIPEAMDVGKYYWQKLGYNIPPYAQKKLVKAFGEWIDADPALVGSKDALLKEATDLLKKPGGMSGMTSGERKIGKEFLLSKKSPNYKLQLELDRGSPFYQAVKRNLDVVEMSAPRPIRRAVVGENVPEIPPSLPPRAASVAKAAAVEPPGGTLGTNPGKIAARKAEAAAQPDLPPPPPLAKGQPGPALKAIDDMEALERETIDLGHRSTRLYFRLKHLREARELLGSPEGLQKLSAAGLAEVIQLMKEASPEAYVGLRGIWERFVDKDLAGMVPDDIASLSQTRARLWSGLDEKDVPLLAAWTRLQYPGKAFPGGEPVPSKKPMSWSEEGRGQRLIHRAFNYLGGRVAKRAIGGGFGVYALGWSAADAAWQGNLSRMMRGAKVATLNRIDKGLAGLAKAQNMRPLAGAAVGPVGAQLSAKDYEDSAREIHAMAGAGGREALYAATQNIRFIDPDLADKIVDNGLKKVEYLAKALPKPPPQGLFKSTRWVPSDVDRAKLSGIFRAVEDPPFAVEQMARGRLTPAVAAAFRETSPGLYAKVASALVDFANANPDAPVSVRRQVAVMLGAPADELQMYTAQLQAAFVAEPGDMGPAVTAKAPQNLPTQAQQITER